MLVMRGEERDTGRVAGETLPINSSLQRESSLFSIVYGVAGSYVGGSRSESVFKPLCGEVSGCPSIWARISVCLGQEPKHREGAAAVEPLKPLRFARDRLTAKQDR